VVELINSRNSQGHGSSVVRTCFFNLVVQVMRLINNRFSKACVSNLMLDILHSRDSVEVQTTKLRYKLDLHVLGL